MRRHLWILVAGLSLGTWVGAQPRPVDERATNTNTNVPVGTVGGGGIGPSVPRESVRVPSGPTQQLPPGPGATPGGRVLVANDPGIWDEKSWICWWETNRDQVLARLAKRRPALAPPSMTPPAADAKPPEERERAVKALVQATKADRPALRAAAAVSLGQMRQEDALKGLIDLATKDPDERVRGTAWMAVGLIGNADAQKAISAAKPRTEFEHLGLLAGIGLMDRPGEPMFRYVRDLLAKPPTVETARMALWALRAHPRPLDHDVVRATPAQSPPPPPALLSEAVLALGAIGDPRDVDFLADVATDGQTANIPDQVVVAGGGTYTQRNRATYIAPGQQGQDTGVVRTGPVLPQAGNRQRAAARSSYPRVSGALALGMSPDGGKPLASSSVLARNALLANFAGFLDQGGPAYSGASIISFALATADRDVFILRDLVDMGVNPTIGMVNPKSPMRGFAAIGLGLYMANGGPSRIATRPIGDVAPPGYDLTLPDYIDINETLALRYSNRQESQDLRAACALALGLSGDPANVQRLLQGTNHIDRRDEMLLGYTVLALAMLGDKSALNAAGPLLSAGRAGAKIDVDAVATRGIPTPGVTAPLSLRAAAAATPWEEIKVPQDGPAALSVLGRRAALLGVSLLTDPRTESILAGAWARDRATLQDVARAIGWTRAHKLADPLSELVERNQKGAIEAALSLGWAFDPDRPSRFSRLVIGNNYHQPQTDYVEGVLSAHMLRDFPRLADLYLYSTAIGGQPIPAPRAPAAAPGARRPPG